MGGILLVAGIITLLASFYYEYQRKKQIMWLVLGTHQFTLLEPTRERTFHDDDVVSMSLQVKENFSNGVHASTTRTFRIWVVSHENLPELIILKSTNKVAESPLLVPFIERISQQLLRRAQEERLRNQSTLGEGWELSSQQLLLRSSLGDLEVPLKELVAVQPVDGKLKIWSTQSEHAVAELPVDSANAHLLQLLLQQHIAHQVQIPAQAAGHLGHILFEKRTHRIPLIVMGIFAILLFFVFLLIGLAIIAGKGAPQDRNAQWIALAFVTLVLSFFVFLCYGYWRSFIRCHARG
ncbi:MAG TPA: hypothetical protein PKD72_14340, partial [Gemmatales bacterium]|nr:hypothetical protein [Gemmatales bacterium]